MTKLLPRMKMESDLRKSGHESDSGDKSDGDLVVDVGGDEDGARRPHEWRFTVTWRQDPEERGRPAT